MALTGSPRDVRFRDILVVESTLTSTAVSDLAGRPATVYTVDINNASGTAVYVKLYNATAATVSDTHIVIIMVINGTQRIVGIPGGILFTKGVSMRCVKEGGTAGATSPTGGNVGVSLVMS